MHTGGLPNPGRRCGFTFGPGKYCDFKKGEAMGKVDQVYKPKLGGKCPPANNEP